MFANGALETMVSNSAERLRRSFPITGIETASRLVSGVWCAHGRDKGREAAGAASAQHQLDRGGVGMTFQPFNILTFQPF